MDRYREEPEQIRMDFQGFEMGRGEFFAHTREPCFTLSDGKVLANTACIRKMQDIDHIQILINQSTHKLVIRACGEEDLFSLPWCRTKNGIRYPRAITGPVFIMKVCSLMGWNPDNRIRMLGKFCRANEDLIFLFDMDGAEEFERRTDADGKRKTSRTPHFAASLENVFGPLFTEHKKELGFNIHQGFAVMSVREGRLKPRETNPTKGAEEHAGDYHGHRPEEEPSADS